MAVSVIGTPKSDGELFELTVTVDVTTVTVNDRSTGIAAGVVGAARLRGPHLHQAGAGDRHRVAR